MKPTKKTRSRATQREKMKRHFRWIALKVQGRPALRRAWGMAEDEK